MTHRVVSLLALAAAAVVLLPAAPGARRATAEAFISRRRAACLRVLFIATLTVGTVLLVPDAAQAQDCPSRPWPTTQFKVVHRTHPFNVVAWLDALIKGAVYDDDLEAALALADSAWERVIEDYLQDIARRLESAGFGCPNLRLYRVGRDEVPRLPDRSKR